MRMDSLWSQAILINIGEVLSDCVYIDRSSSVFVSSHRIKCADRACPTTINNLHYTTLPLFTAATIYGLANTVHDSPKGASRGFYYRLHSPFALTATLTIYAAVSACEAEAANDSC
jgi:hypothetical protein